MAKQTIDLSGRIGQMFRMSTDAEPELPMYSYERPAWMLWNAIADGLAKRGWTEKQIIEWLQSKQTRWALDMDLGDAITKLGNEYAKTAEKL